MTATGTVAERLERLRNQAASDARGAQDETWTWIEELGAARDGDALAALFALGTPSPAIDGPTEGILVTTLTSPLVDVPIDKLTDGWMPWTGKTFDAASASGVNQMTKDSAVAAKLLWPLYKMREGPEGKLAFDFKTGIVDSAIAPAMKVLKIEYEHVEENPALLIRQILDELVELVNATYLGRILFKLPVKGFVNIGCFGLRQPA